MSARLKNLLVLICCAHFKPFETCKPNNLSVATLSTVSPRSVTDGRRSFNVELMNISFVFLVLICIPFSDVWWSSSSTNNCIQLMSDTFRISVIVVSSTNWCITDRMECTHQHDNENSRELNMLHFNFVENLYNIFVRTDSQTWFWHFDR